MKVSVCMITYNHEKYISAAIDSVLTQDTNFDFDLIIANDGSSDLTDSIIQEYIGNHPLGHKIKYLKNTQNIGMMPNFTQALQQCSGEYVALCEGDDYWTNSKKLQKQVDFLDNNQEFSICFHRAQINKDGHISDDTITRKVKAVTTISDLAQGNYMHTCTVLYRNHLIKELPDYFSQSPVGDYFLHMLNSRYGDIYCMDEIMAVYRIHDTSYWSSKNQAQRVRIWIDFLEKIKPNFDTKVCKEIDLQIHRLSNMKRGVRFRLLKLFDLEQKEVVIFDDMVPSLLSPWRNYEYAKICEEFKNVKIYTTLTTYMHYNQGLTRPENQELLCNLYPSMREKIWKLRKYKIYRTKLAYFIFYNNLVAFYPILKSQKIPFTFTLYPGGGFCFDNSTIDSFLKEVFRDSLCKGVVVTQNCVKDYLIKNKICREGQITSIPGVSLNLEKEQGHTYSYNKDGDRTHLLFFANKYTSDGSDKGFDTFQRVILGLRHLIPNFTFTVIGGFTKNDLVDDSLSHIIDFKGVLNETEFENVLQKTHINLSANQPFKIFEGSFDGFPLATCVIASLFGNVNLMTDYFNESPSTGLAEGVDYIKITTDVDAIIEKILLLHSDRELMRTIALNGREKSLEIYSCKRQIVPRITHLKKALC